MIEIERDGGTRRLEIVVLMGLGTEHFSKVLDELAYHWGKQLLLSKTFSGNGEQTGSVADGKDMA